MPLFSLPPFTTVFCAAASCPAFPSAASKTAPVVADRVRAMGVVCSFSGAEGGLPDKTAADDVAVDCGSVGMRETPLWPPTVGSQPLVLPVFSWLLGMPETAGGRSDVVRWVGCGLF